MKIQFNRQQCMERLRETACRIWPEGLSLCAATMWIRYVLLAAAMNVIMEAVSRHSLIEAFTYIGEKPLVYLYNTLLIAMFYLAVYLVRKKIFAAAFVTAVWLLAGISNGVILANRVTPLTGPDLDLLSDLVDVIRLYMEPWQLILAGVGIAAAVGGLAWLFRRAKREKAPMHYVRRFAVTAVLAAGFFGLTHLAVEKRVISTYFSNVAYAYQDYGFPYCFLTSVFDTGMSEPHDYSERLIDKIVDFDQETVPTEEGGSRPNIIFVQLETFFDATLLKNIELSEDPIPNFRRYMEEYSSGYFEVPVVGAGTANTEFETIVGMNLRYFGPGEYPYKTVLQKTTCESMAYALKNIGYTAHAIHDNTAAFYGRNVVFANLGFDTFTSIELMDSTEKTETGWADDSVLTGYILDCLKSSDGSDFVYAISVQGHGSYPEEQVLQDPAVRVLSAETEEERNQWEYYVNQLYEMDEFVEELIQAVSEFGEDTVVVMYGDHLPTMGIEARDMANGHLYSTEYFIWDNMGLEKEDKNLATYQLGAVVTDRLGIHEGVMMRYHQERMGQKYYMQDMETLQYDMLYGEQYAWGGKNPFTATDLQMGIRDISVRHIEYTSQNRAYIFGENFTPYCEVSVNGEEAETMYLNSSALIIHDVELKAGDTLTVRVENSKDKILKESEGYVVKTTDLPGRG